MVWVKRWVDVCVRPFFVLLNVSCATGIIVLIWFGNDDQVERYFTPSVILFSALLATTGWLWSGHLSRKLNRKQQALNLLLALRSPHVNEWKEEVYSYIDNHKAADEPIMTFPTDAADRLLGFYEFLSIAVMNGTADEEIIKESQRYVYIRLSNGLKDYIHDLQEDEASIYCHFTEYAEKWNEDRKRPNFVKKD